MLWECQECSLKIQIHRTYYYPGPATHHLWGWGPGVCILNFLRTSTQSHIAPSLDTSGTRGKLESATKTMCCFQTRKPLGESKEVLVRTGFLKGSKITDFLNADKQKYQVTQALSSRPTQWGPVLGRTEQSGWAWAPCNIPPRRQLFTSMWHPENVLEPVISSQFHLIKCLNKPPGLKADAGLCTKTAGCCCLGNLCCLVLTLQVMKRLDNFWSSNRSEFWSTE